MTEVIIDWPSLLERLAEPFSAEQVKWRAGSVSRDKNKAIALAYAEPRAYEDRLNAVCAGNWHVGFQPWGNERIICRLTIHNLTRASTGEGGDSNPSIAGTSAEAQAFKRACSKFGLGRYLYDLPTSWVAYDPNTKRLLATPDLPLPTAKSSPKAVDLKNRAGPSQDQGEQLGPTRAVAMHGKLTSLGLEPEAHITFASSVLRREVNSFSALRESDARAVWRRAVKWAQNLEAPVQQHSSAP